MGALVLKSGGQVVMYQQGRVCTWSIAGFPGSRLSVFLLRIASKYQPITKVKTHMKEEEQADKETMRSSVTMLLCGFFVALKVNFPTYCQEVHLFS